MSPPARPHPLRWVPPFLAGAAAATAAEVTLALLLYEGPGLMRSLTTVLVVEATALSLGLWAVPVPEPEPVESLRRRWLFCMVIFLVATLFSASWSLVEEVGGGRLGQGLGLASMGALPLYGCGSVLSGMAAFQDRIPGARRAALAAPAALGAALGFLATGLALPRLLTPASLFLICLVLLSTGGLVYGAVLDRILQVRVRASRPAASGEVRVEDRYDPSSRVELRVLVEGGWIRRWAAPQGDGNAPPWDVAVFQAASASWDPDGEGSPPRVLVVGGGASPLPRAAVRAHPSVRVDVVERSLAVVELAREELDTGLEPGVRDRIRVGVGNLEDLLEELEAGYDLVLVDTTAFRPLGGLVALSRDARGALTRSLAPSGVLALGPVAPEAGSWAPPRGWSRLRVRRAASGVEEVVRGGPAAPEEILLYAPGALPAELDALGQAVEEPGGADGDGTASAPAARGEGEAGGAPP